MEINDTYQQNNPLVLVIQELIRRNKIGLAENVIDAFSESVFDLESLNCLTKLYYDVRIFEKCEEFGIKALNSCETEEQKYNMRTNLSKIYNAFNEPIKSIFYSNQNLSINPNDNNTKLEKAHSLFLNNEKSSAEKILRNMKATEYFLEDRHKDIVNFNLGTYDMEAGEFHKGLKGIITNTRKLGLWNGNINIPLKRWEGGLYPGKTIIMVMSGGGFGDSFIAISYWIKLKQAGFNPIYCNEKKELIEIFNRCGYNSVTDWRYINAPEALWCFAFDVPFLLNIKPEHMLSEHYLWASEEAGKKWDWIKKSKKLKVGVRFIGNKRNNDLLYRHIELNDMMNFLHDTFNGVDVEYYSLQKGDGEEEVSKCPELINIADKIESFDDTIAIIENLDIIISTCTSIVHLGGAIGTKTVVFVPITAYFTYLTKPKNRPEHTSLWYGDNFRFFMQQKPKVWDEPMLEAKKYIQENLLN
jgi:hypothetical protein